jgi:CBS domain-containing protein
VDCSRVFAYARRHANARRGDDEGSLTVEPSDTIGEAAEKMTSHGVGRVVVSTSAG